MAVTPRTLAALSAIAVRFAAVDVDWLLVGGVARALAGADHRPSDLDVEVAPDDRERAADALGVVGAVRRDARVRSWYATTRIASVAVDVSSELSVHGPELTLPADWETQRRWAGAVMFAGRVIPVAPMEELLVRALVGADARGMQRRLTLDVPAPRARYVAVRLAAATASANS